MITHRLLVLRANPIGTARGCIVASCPHPCLAARAASRSARTSRFLRRRSIVANTRHVLIEIRTSALWLRRRGHNKEVIIGTSEAVHCAVRRLRSVRTSSASSLFPMWPSRNSWHGTILDLHQCGNESRRVPGSGGATSCNWLT